MEVSNNRFTNRRFHRPAVVQAAQYQLEPQAHLLQGMSLTNLYHVAKFPLHFRATPSLNHPEPSSDYQFVEQPSQDFFCPVTCGLLLQPHLTSCCGNHISQEAASRIQRERGACPIYKTNPWNTMFSKHFHRQVKSCCVFCRHDDRGCGWQGELAEFDNHIQSCPMKDAPLMTSLSEFVKEKYACMCL